MSTTTNITALAERIRDEFNSHKVIQGALAGLQTVDKSSLVNAINEIVANVGVGIDDATTNASTTWSSNKIQSEVNTAVASILGGAGVDDDTLSELAAKISALAAADVNLVSADEAQPFTETQQAQARANISAPSIADTNAIQADATQALSNSATAQADATQALSDSASAQTDATTAISNASTAQTDATQALADASAAQTDATQALSDASAAQTSANTANNTATTNTSAIADLSTNVGDTDRNFVLDFTTGLNS